MTTKTRYFVIVSLLVLFVGLGTGLVAYYVGFPTHAFSSAGGPDELRYLPHNSSVVAYANVRDLMTSELRQHVHAAMPMGNTGQREFQEETGINIEQDVDRVVGCLNPGQDGKTNGEGLALVRGRFDQFKIETLVKQHGGTVDDYKGKHFMSASNGKGEPVGLSFIEPGLVAVGSKDLVQAAIDRASGGDNVTNNEELMNLVRSMGDGNTWAVGRFDVLRSQAKLPATVDGKLPPINWFSLSGHVNGGIRGVLRAETSDEEAANNLRDVVRGFMALAKMQSASKPELQAMMQSLELGGTGKTVSLSFAVPAAVFDMMAKDKHAGH